MFLDKDYFIARVYINKGNKQKLLTVPSKININEGDLVVVKKYKPEVGE